MLALVLSRLASWSYKSKGVGQTATFLRAVVLFSCVEGTVCVYMRTSYRTSMDRSNACRMRSPHIGSKVFGSHFGRKTRCVLTMGWHHQVMSTHTSEGQAPPVTL
ncbi:hypothetical protein SODALDRAFT_362777 [Sodiomyces alkalinus F11]|uniref:Uncharacterized protein n=1 Tax=Sodiomyces alkalinus (strain CBS 110278 / VKM F-3762 / F11) TaxID=1314773 RepID=A0A3N2PN51_SODAK|nr:hypothetical protein SODALDRAFT_362777 [Sodiomyces alkalinus F11]ROT35923.1 hypothetical protein SODALDRAFT_362777 [Sodiomyces alkalinus F11]